MACSLNKIKSDSTNKVRGIIKDVVPESMLNYYGNPVLSNEVDLEPVHKAINDWSTQLFGPKYNGQWINVQNRVNTNVLNVTFPVTLERKYKIAINNNEKQIKESTLEDSVIESTPFSQPGANFMLTSSTPKTEKPNGFSFGSYVRQKNTFKRRVIKTKEVIQEKADKNKADLVEIQRLNNIVELLDKDLSDLKKKEVTMENVFDYFENDLKNITSTLLDNPTEENLMLAEGFLDDMEFVTTQKEGINSKDKFSEKPYTLLEEELVKKFEKFAGQLQTANNKLEREQRKLAYELMTKEKEEGYPFKSAVEKEAAKIEEVVKRKPNKFATLARALFYPLESSKRMSPILGVIRKMFDDSVGRKITEHLERALVVIQPQVEAELIRLGHIAPNVIGAVKASYAIFKTIDSQGNHRLIGKFSNKWDSVLNLYADRLEKISRLPYIKEKPEVIAVKIASARKKLFRDFVKKKVKFIDVRQLPQLINDKDLSEFKEDFFPINEAEEYEAKLKRMLLGITMDKFEKLSPEEQQIRRDSAKRQYDRIVEEQRVKMYNYQIALENKMNQVRNKDGVNTFEELSVESQTELTEFEAMYSPVSFSEQYTNEASSEVPQQGTDKKIPSSLIYSSFIPANTEYFNDKFQNSIESNKIMYKAWTIMSDSLTFENRNRKYRKSSDLNNYDDSLPYASKRISDHVAGLSEFIDNFDVNIKQLMKDNILKSAGKNAYNLSNMLKAMGDKVQTETAKVISTKSYVAKENEGLSDVQRSLDEVINEVTNIALANLVSHGIDVNRSAAGNDKISAEANLRLKKVLGNDFDSKSPIKKTVRDTISAAMNEQQSENLIDSLKSTLPLVRDFKAKKEVEDKLLFLRNMFIKFAEETNQNAAKLQLTLIDLFITRSLYGINNRQNWFVSKKGDEHAFNLTTPERKVLTATINDAIVDIGDRIEKLKLADISEGERSKRHILLTSEKNKLIRLKNQKGNKVTAGSVTETILIKSVLLTGLGYNLTAQINNYAIGNIALHANDGLYWKSGNAEKAAAFSAKSKVLLRKTSGLVGLKKKEREDYALANSFLNAIGIFQNSANEVDNFLETSNSKELGMYIKKPFHLIGQVEKTIQRPQILAMLGDPDIASITNKRTGETHAVFDLDYKPGSEDHPSPFPGFVLSKDGLIELHEDYDTPENRETWINKESNEYVNLFGDSGTLPVIIARINGDFRKSTNVLAKSNTFLAASMMFKSWLPAHIDMKYNEDYGVIAKMRETGAGKYSFATVNLQRAAHAASAAYVASPVIGMSMSIVYYGLGSFFRRTKKDLNFAQHIHAEARSMAYEMGFTEDGFKREMAVDYGKMVVGDSYRYGIGLLGKLAQSVVGKKRLSDDSLNKVIFKRQLGEVMDKQEEADLDMNMKRLHFLMAELRRTIYIVAARIGAMMTWKVVRDMFDDDEEDEAILGVIDGTYYVSENLLTRHSDDLNLMNDPHAFEKTLIDGNVGNYLDRLDGLFEASQGSTPIYLKGENAGRNKYGVILNKIILNKILEDNYLGFKQLSSKDYRPNDLLSRMNRTTKDKLITARALYKLEKEADLREEILTDNPNLSAFELKKIVETRIKDMKIPSITGKDFDNKEELLEDKENKYNIFDEYREDK